MKILIDNGHGSDTKGKYSPDKRLYEYKFAREIAGRVEKELRAKGYDVQLIVPETNDVPLLERVRRVNDVCNKVGSSNALLVSIHVNAAGADGKWHDARGFSVFVSKNASTNSKRCATIFTDEAQALNLIGNRSVPREKYWTWSWTTADIYILKNTKCPAVLTENFFQDNKADVDYLLSENGKATITKLHVDCIIKYLKAIGK